MRGKGFIFILLAYLALCFMAASCSAGWHIKKAIAKDPSLLKSDTLIIRDSVKVVTNHVETDSVFMLSSDTVTIVKDNLTIRHFYHNDSIYIYGECDSTIIYKPYEVIVTDEKLVYNETWFPKWMWWVIALVVVLFFLNRLIPKR